MRRATDCEKPNPIAISGPQRPSAALIGPHLTCEKSTLMRRSSMSAPSILKYACMHPSVALSGTISSHQMPSAALRGGHQRSSALIRAHSRRPAHLRAARDVFKFDERVIERIARLIVAHDRAFLDGTESAEDELEVLVLCHRVELAHEEHILRRGEVRIWQISEHLEDLGAARSCLGRERLLYLPSRELMSVREGDQLGHQGVFSRSNQEVIRK